MRRERLDQMVGGWFVGDFTPAALRTTAAEVCVKTYQRGDKEPQHYQRVAIEVTCILSGTARMGSELLGPGDIIVLDPLDAYDFEALSDVTLVAFKTPSAPNDKVLGTPE